MVGSSELFAAGGAEEEAALDPSADFPPELVPPGRVANNSVNWSRRSDSNRPFEVSN
jgi:hypothetical protein